MDDLASLVYGGPHAVAAQIFLVAAAHCAGLVTAAHSCQRLRLSELSPRGWLVLERFPVRVTRCTAAWEVEGLPPLLLLQVLRTAGALAASVEARVASCRCSCSVSDLDG